MSDMVEILRGLGMDDVAEEIERLRARILELEAEAATLRGTLSEVKLRNEYLEYEWEDGGFRSEINHKDALLSAASETLAKSQKESARHLAESYTRIAGLEAEIATLRGSMEQRQSEAEQRQVFGIIQDVPPSTPR